LEGKEEKYEMENPEGAYTIGSEREKNPFGAFLLLLGTR